MRAVSLTNRGGRKNNEDYVGYANSDKLWCFVVCDGLGGQSFGEVASEIVCETVCKSFKKAPELSGKALYRYIEKAASVLGEERESTKSNMSSTIVALVTDGEKAVWAHSGDSRLYYISKKRISQITDDHSIAFRDFKEGIITFDEIRTSPNQNKLLSSISDIDDLNFDVSEVIDLKKGARPSSLSGCRRHCGCCRSPAASWGSPAGRGPPVSQRCRRRHSPVPVRAAPC